MRGFPTHEPGDIEQPFAVFAYFRRHRRQLSFGKCLACEQSFAPAASRQTVSSSAGPPRDRPSSNARALID